MNKRNASVERNKKIPPPPGPEDGYDAIIEYFQKYNWDELERAGYLQEPSPRELEDIVASATYERLSENGLRIDLPQRDCERLARLAARTDTPVETLVKRWIKQGLRGERKAAKK